MVLCAPLVCSVWAQWNWRPGTPRTFLGVYHGGFCFFLIITFKKLRALLITEINHVHFVKNSKAQRWQGVPLPHGHREHRRRLLCTHVTTLGSGASVSVPDPHDTAGGARTAHVPVCVAAPRAPNLRGRRGTPRLVPAGGLAPSELSKPRDLLSSLRFTHFIAGSHLLVGFHGETFPVLL